MLARWESKCLLEVWVKGIITLNTNVYLIFRIPLHLAHSWMLKAFKIHSVDSALGWMRLAPAHYLVNLRFQGFTRTVCTDISRLASHRLSAGVEFGQGKYTSGLKWLQLTSTALLHTLCAIQAQSVSQQHLKHNVVYNKKKFHSLKNNSNLGYNGVLTMMVNEADS